MHPPFITIVANLYDSGRYIPRLIRSVASQTFSDFELVAVVDASPGNDASILEKHIKKNGLSDKARIIVNPTNVGIARSKKVGIDAANGKYIAFVDGDDFFSAEALEHLAKPALDYNVDFVNMNYCRYYAPIRKRVDICVPFSDGDYDRVILKDEFFDKCFINFFGGYFIALAYWAKLYRTSLLKALPFDYPAQGDTVAEDKWMNMAAFQHIQSAYFVRHVGYFWRWGGISSVRLDDSWSLTKDYEKHIEYFAVQKGLIDKYNYRKGWLPLIENLLNKFIEAISQLARYDVSSPKSGEVLNYISTCLDFPPMGHIAELREICRPGLRPVVDAIASKDTLGVYEYMRREYEAAWKLRAARSVMYYLLFPFR